MRLWQRRALLKSNYKKKELAHKLIRLDADIWGPDYSEGEFTTPGGIKGKKSPIYIDERSGKEYETFKKYFKVVKE